jgi:D-alanyl-D-alanine carboxypeptidase
MKRIACFSALLFGCLFFLVCSCKKKSDPDYTAVNEQIVAEWERVSDSMLSKVRVPGMIIGIWAPGRGLAWVTGKGKSNVATGEKPDPGMKFRMGSLTKTYTYTVLLQLVDEDSLRLTDKLSRFMPDFPKADSITMTMLCNHTSGIFDYTETTPFQVNLMIDPFRVWSGQEFIDMVKTEPFYFSPGTGFRYSNTNTIIAGEIIRQVTGNPVEIEIQQRIITPLHLANTFYPSGYNMPGPYTHGYDWIWDSDTTHFPDVAEAYDPSIGGAAGAMVADVYDLKNWVETLYRGTLLKPATQAERLTVVPAPGEDCEEYGLGIMHKINPPMWGHTGTIPGYKNWAGYSPELNVTIVISYNSTQSKPMLLACRLMNIYTAAIMN